MNVSISTLTLLVSGVLIGVVGFVAGYLTGKNKSFSNGMEAGLEAGKETASHSGNGTRSVGYGSRIIPTPPTQEGPRSQTRIGS